MIVKSNVSSGGRSSLTLFLSDEGPTRLETLDFTTRVGNTPSFLYFDLYLNTLPAHHTTFIGMYNCILSLHFVLLSTVLITMSFKIVLTDVTHL